MKGIYALFGGQVIDRRPDPEARWYDVEYQVEKQIAAIEKGSFLGEISPLLWPNIDPNIFAGMLGCELKFGDVTGWAIYCME